MAYGFGAFGRSWGYGGLPARAKPAFSPIDLAPDLWMPSDPLAMFKTSFGIENVAANDDTIGLLVDQARMGGLPLPEFVAALPNILRPPTAIYPPWVDNGDGTFSIDGSQTTGITLYYNNLTPAGNEIYVDFEVVSVSAGTLKLLSNPASSPAVSTAGIFSQSMACPTGNFNFYADADFVGTIRPISIKAIPGSHASQATTNSRPKFKSAGFRQYDGVDDYLTTQAKCGGGGNTLAIKIVAPPTNTGTTIISGFQGSGTGRFYLAMRNGLLSGGVGNQGSASINGGGDIFDQTGIAMLIEDGASVFLYWNGVLLYSGAREGDPLTSAAIFEGAVNNTGTPGSCWGGGVFDLLFFQRAITPVERAQILNYWS